MEPQFGMPNWAESPMQASDRGEITKLLDAWRQGEQGADDRLFARLYPTLTRLAAALASKFSEAGSWHATELLHEAFFNLREQRQVHWQNRGHFFSIAARVLRRTLVDSWRRRSRQKRGSGQDEIPLEEVHVVVDQTEIDRLALEQALRRLACIDPVAARAVELLAIEGFSYNEAARVLGVGRATVSRSWRFGRAFLCLQMAGGSTAQGLDPFCSHLSSSMGRVYPPAPEAADSKPRIGRKNDS